MSRVDLSKVPDYLRQQRWFAGKSTPIQSVALADTVELPLSAGDGAPVLAIVEVTYVLGAKERYLMPVVTGADGSLQEALAEEAVAYFLLELIRQGFSVRSAAAELRSVRLESALPELAKLGAHPALRPLSAEQSNTSLVFGERVLLKVFRRLEAGANLELEVGRFLAGRTSFRATPALLGALELEGAAPATVAVLHHFEPNQGDGWTWCLEQYRSAEPAPEVGAEFEHLGRVLGELHVALASGTDDPLFAPESILTEDVQRWSSSLIGELGVTLSLAQASFPDVERLREPLVKRAQRLADLSDVGKRQRIHGDLHLGQALRSPRGWLIYDFEGEPARSSEQRRAKHSALRDVAGMMRSFGYAAAVAGLPHLQAKERVIASSGAFMRGYRRATAGADFLPAREEMFAHLLEALTLERTLYEVRYELQTRPDWARIPIAYLHELAEVGP